MNDQRTVRLVLQGLIVVSVLIVLGAIAAALEGKTIPGELYLALGTTIGAISGMLSQTNATPPGGVPVKIEGPDPVPVAETPTRRRRSAPAPDPEETP